MSGPTLSIIVPFRSRHDHLRVLLEWATERLPLQCEMIVVEHDIEPVARSCMPAHDRVFYQHINGTGTFHLARCLNVGLAAARGALVAAYDVDLLPVANSLDTHISLAQQHPDLLITGYVIRTPRTVVPPADVGAVACADAVAGPEHLNAQFLLDQLVRGERWGVLPFYEKALLRAIGAWDEAFIGWGAEDQDLIERYLESGKRLVQCPDLVYLHQSHGEGSDWREEHHVLKNRELYYLRRSERMRE